VTLLVAAISGFQGAFDVFFNLLWRRGLLGRSLRLGRGTEQKNAAR